MSVLTSLSRQANVAVIGASGGIGRAFTELLAADESVQSVHALSRSAIDWGNGKVHHQHLDLTDEASIEKAASAASAESALDLVIVASGILHRGSQVQPEKTLRDLQADSLHAVMAVNAVGPALVAKHFLPRLRRGRKTVFAALSARVGSISDNRLGGWAAYRMSKAALNMLVRTMAIEQSRSRPDSILVALHPGTVDTALSQPFTKRLDADKLFSTSDAASRLLDVIDSLEQPMTGGFYAYDKSRIDF